MKTLTEKQVLRIIKRAAKKKGAASGWARIMKVSRQYISDMLLGKRPPTEELAKLANPWIQRLEGWIEIPKEMQDKKYWSFEELMEKVNYKNN